MEKLDPCPKCGSEKIEGPKPSRRKINKRGQKYQRQMRFNCFGCDHVYQFDVHGSDVETRERQAVARWIAARPAQMEPTKRLASQLGMTD